VVPHETGMFITLVSSVCSLSASKHCVVNGIVILVDLCLYTTILLSLCSIFCGLHVPETCSPQKKKLHEDNIVVYSWRFTNIITCLL
jgi:hypothetical protein